ncbi:Protein O-mannosyltransferase 2, partial [Cladochytrium tenue]
VGLHWTETISRLVSSYHWTIEPSTLNSASTKPPITGQSWRQQRTIQPASLKGLPGSAGAAFTEGPVSNPDTASAAAGFGDLSAGAAAAADDVDGCKEVDRLPVFVGPRALHLHEAPPPPPATSPLTPPPAPAAAARRSAARPRRRGRPSTPSNNPRPASSTVAEDEDHDGDDPRPALRRRGRRDGPDDTDDQDDRDGDHREGVDEMDRSAEVGDTPALRWLDWMTPLGLTLLAFATRMYDLGRSDYVVWLFASNYLSNTFFFDVHPPLGKMLLALAGAFVGYDGSFDFKSGTHYPPGLNYVGMRAAAAAFGAAVVPLAYYTARELHLSRSASALLACLILT